MTPEKEAVILAIYLLKKLPSERVVSLYTKAVQQQATLFDKNQQSIWSACMKRPQLLPLIDAGLAWNQPFHPVRQRIYFMIALLETQPENQLHFEPVKRNALYLMKISWKAAWSIVKMITGRMILWVL